MFFRYERKKQHFETNIKIEGKFQKVLTMTNVSVYKYVLNKVNIFWLQRMGLFLGTLFLGCDERAK